MTDIRRGIAWWYWLLAATGLGLGVAGWSPGYGFAIGGTLVHGIHYLSRGHGPGSLPLQVRIAYLALLVLGLWPPLAFVHLLQLAGTSALLAFDYCALARALALMPWNRRLPLSPGLVGRIFFTPPVRGSVLRLVGGPVT